MDKEVSYENLIKIIDVDRNKALKHFVVKNHIKVNKKFDIFKHLMKTYVIHERVNEELNTKDKGIIKRHVT